MEILAADKSDLKTILELQYLAYQSEADLFGTRDIPPLKQTLEEVVDEFNTGIILKLLADNRMIGSVRAKEKDGTVYFYGNDGVIRPGTYNYNGEDRNFNENGMMTD